MQTLKCLPAFVAVLVVAAAAPVALAIDDHLLLTEAAVTPTAGEFLEITNPTGATIDLSNYYLSDDEDYALTPGLFGAGPAPNISDFDFICQFPPGATIAPGQVVVIAMHGAGFITTYGIAADYEVDGSDAGTPDMIATIVGSSFSLTNSGENAVLFFWDGASDLVSDVDMVHIGTPSASNDIGDKSGLMVDGPDADTDPSTYAPDAVTMPQQMSDPGFGFSTKRILDEASGGEVTGGGNGITGDDETTEDITITWDSVYTAPNPGVLVGGCTAVSGLSCDSPDCGNMTVSLAWTNEDAYVSIEILRNGVSVGVLPGTDTEFSENGVPSGIHLYVVAATCSNGATATTSCSVFHCPPPKSDDLIISEIVDGTLEGLAPVFPFPTPRFVELTNCSTTDTVDLQFYSLGNYNNGSMTLGGGESEILTGTLGPGESYIVAYDTAANTRFDEVYGFDPDFFVGGGFINGNDVLALYYGFAVNDNMGGVGLIGTSELIDIYGVIGVDGADQDWNYIESYAFRNVDEGQSVQFTASQWTIAGEGALRGPDDMTDEDEFELLLKNTFPGAHDCESANTNALRGDVNNDGDINFLVDALALLSFGFIPGSPVPPCLTQADFNGDRTLNALVDALYGLSAGFIPGSPPPPPPYPACGDDANGYATLGCITPSSCP